MNHLYTILFFSGAFVPNTVAQPVIRWDTAPLPDAALQEQLVDLVTRERRLLINGDPDHPVDITTFWTGPLRGRETVVYHLADGDDKATRIGGEEHLKGLVFAVRDGERAVVTYLSFNEMTSFVTRDLSLIPEDSLAVPDAVGIRVLVTERDYHCDDRPREDRYITFSPWHCSYTEDRYYRYDATARQVVEVASER